MHFFLPAQKKLWKWVGSVEVNLGEAGGVGEMEMSLVMYGVYPHTLRGFLVHAAAVEPVSCLWLCRGRQPWALMPEERAEC